MMKCQDVMFCILAKFLERDRFWSTGLQGQESGSAQAIRRYIVEILKAEI